MSRQRGTIIKRKLADGTEVWDIKYRTSGGRQIMRRGYPSKEAANRELMNRLLHGEPPSGSVYFAEVAEDWYKLKVEPEAAEETKRIYRSVLKTHLLPAFGDKRLSSIERRDIEECVSSLHEPTANLVYHTLKSIFEAAVEWGKLAQNPAAGLWRKPNQRKESRHLTPHEAARLISQAQDPTDRAIVLLALHAGLRRGEIFGLRWEDIDETAGLLHIKRQYQRGHIRTLKTPAAMRVIPMSGMLRTALLGLPGAREGYLFPGAKRDKPADPGTWIQARLKPMLKRADLPDMPLHALRHSCATHLFAAGVSPDTVKRILGHASISTTSDIYGHLYLDSLEGAAKKLDQLYE